jgi:histidinol-phosphatase
MKPPENDITERLELAVEAAREAGLITLEHFRDDDLRVDRKADDTPVTVADRRAEEHLRSRISEVFPADAILGEEFPDRSGESGFRWILDPIDGTKSFIHGVPLYGTLVGVEYQDQPLLGVIRIPALDQCVYAAVGRGAWLVDGRRTPKAARVSTCEKLSEAVFLTSEVATFDEIDRRDAYFKLQDATRLARTWGDGYGYFLVATGQAEVMVDPVVALWDIAAMLPIMDEAGGNFTDWSGKRTTHSGNGIATNGRLHDEVLAAIKPANH